MATEERTTRPTAANLPCDVRCVSDLCQGTEVTVFALPGRPGPGSGYGGPTARDHQLGVAAGGAARHSARRDARPSQDARGTLAA